MRANFPHVNPFAGSRPVRMTRKRFHYTFCNTMSRASSDATFDRYVVPESRNVPRSTLREEARIDFGRRHAPLLMIAGDSDHLTPMPLVRRNARAYKQSAGRVDFEVFAGRCHDVCDQEGWEEVADRAVAFLAGSAKQ